MDWGLFANLKIGHGCAILRDDDQVIWDVMRVPGGWIFGNHRGNVFVPYSDEVNQLKETHESD